MLRVLSLFLGFVCVDVVVYACFVVVVVFFSKAGAGEEEQRGKKREG